MMPNVKSLCVREHGGAENKLQNQASQEYCLDDSNIYRHQAWDISEQVLAYMSNALKGKAWKLARLFLGLYRVMAVVTPTNLEIKAVENLTQKQSLFFGQNQTTLPRTIHDMSWCGNTRRKKNNRKRPKAKEDSQTQVRASGPVTRSIIKKAQSSYSCTIVLSLCFCSWN